MEYISELMGQIIPALLIFLLAYFYLKKSEERHLLRIHNAEAQERLKIITPLRLQAYERLILMIERIAMGSLVMRHQNGQQSAVQFQLSLLKSVREEFEHNISMQMYVSEQTWDLVRQAKDESLRSISTAASRLEANAPAMALSREIFDVDAQLHPSVLQLALAALNREVRNLYV